MSQFKRKRRAKPDPFGGVPIKFVSREELERGAGDPGLWNYDTSFFNNPRRLTTVDPSYYEQAHGYPGPNGWCAPIRKRWDGRIEP
jgi:hypothetical protein